jgi:hypothetical protein
MWAIITGLIGAIFALLGVISVTSINHGAGLTDGAVWEYVANVAIVSAFVGALLNEIITAEGADK